MPRSTSCGPRALREASSGWSSAHTHCTRAIKCRGAERSGDATMVSTACIRVDTQSVFVRAGRRGLPSRAPTLTRRGGGSGHWGRGPRDTATQTNWGSFGCSSAHTPTTRVQLIAQAQHPQPCREDAAKRINIARVVAWSRGRRERSRASAKMRESGSAHSSTPLSQSSPRARTRMSGRWRGEFY